MSYLGSWKIDDLLTFPAITHRFDTGALTDADSVPAYRVYEDETSTAIVTGNMAKLDDANTTGFYSEQITLSAANGFEKGKCYTVYITAAVNSVTGGSFHTFQVEAEVDANSVSNIGSGVITATAIAADAIGASELAADAVSEIVTGILTTQMTEAYAADGVAPTLAQALCLIQQQLGDFSISGTTMTVKKVDGSTTAATFTLNDATSPTSITRAT